MYCSNTEKQINKKNVLHLPQLKPPQTERTIMRIKAIIIPRTISFIFIFCSHIFLLICVPCVLKSCAYNKPIIYK
ncbi:hypothetical protein Hanom_Chr15g01343071 [Helianthus anomalus]